MYILIVVGWLYSGSAVYFQEFNTLDSCEAAKTVIINSGRKFASIDCTKK
jgi:hypothetical protein